jgi:glucose/arabinose dehydrogenase
MGPPPTRRRALGLGSAALAASVTGRVRPTSTRLDTLQSGPAVRIEPVVEGLEAPLALEMAPGSDAFYVAEQTGRVRVVEDGTVTGTFLDVRERMTAPRGEKGLLGIAFHPEYDTNGRVYVRYSAPRREGTPSNFSHTEVLSEFVAEGGTVALDTERTLLEIPEPQGNHNAGAVAFGPDGHLYVGTGDGGGGGDQGTGHVEDWYDAVDGGNGQDVATNLLGSILRIDVDGRTDGRPYGIPEDNPLVGREGLDEQWAWGLRNPWRFSFAPDGRLVVADVGQSAYEEVNVVEKGGNYGWNVREGSHCFDANECPDDSPTGPLVEPVLEYPHGGQEVSGNAVIGGYVHRGRLSGLVGEYVFGDFTGGLFVATPDGETWEPRRLTVTNTDDGRPPSSLLAFGEDRDGTLYACLSNGTVYRLAPPEGQTPVPTPASETATPTESATPTPSPAGDDGGGTPSRTTTDPGGTDTTTASGTDPRTPDASGEDGSGFGLLATLAALGLGAGLARQRSRRSE